MKVTAVPHGLDLLQSVGVRSGGLHMSDIYSSLYREIEPDRYSDTGGPDVMKMAMGLAWETYLERCLAASGVQAERPEEFITKEGIAFSPDLLIVNGHDRLGEIKLTYQSSRNVDFSGPKFAKWITQVQAYCYHLGLSQTRFYVLFVNGDYRENRNPDLQTFDLEFTQRELKENWDCLVNHARKKGLL